MKIAELLEQAKTGGSEALEAGMRRFVEEWRPPEANDFAEKERRMVEVAEKLLTIVNSGERQRIHTSLFRWLEWFAWRAGGA